MLPSGSKTKKMKRKGSDIVDVATKHFKPESFVITNVHILREISKLLNEVEVCALMATSSHHYQLLKPDREQHFLRFIEACKPKYAIAHLYRAVKDGFVSRENFMAWVESKELDLVALGFSYIRQHIYDEPDAAPIPMNIRHAYTYLLQDSAFAIVAMESMWRMRMHEDDMAELATRIVTQNPRKYIMDLMLNGMAMCECSPKLLLAVKERASKLELEQPDLSYPCGHYTRTCPSMNYMLAVQEIVPNLTLFILKNENCRKAHRSIGLDPQLLAYFAQRHRAETKRILRHVNSPISDTFPYTKKEVADLLVHCEHSFGNKYLWYYVSDFPTPDLTRLLLSNACCGPKLGTPHIWNYLALVDSAKNAETGQREPGPIWSLAQFLRPHVNDADFVECFLRCFGHLDYRSLVIKLYWHADPPKELLQLEFPVAKSHPQLILYYETLRLKAKYE